MKKIIVLLLMANGYFAQVAMSYTPTAPSCFYFVQNDKQEILSKINCDCTTHKINYKYLTINDTIQTIEVLFKERTKANEENDKLIMLIHQQEKYIANLKKQHLEFVEKIKPLLEQNKK